MSEGVSSRIDKADVSDAVDACMCGFRDGQASMGRLRNGCFCALQRKAAFCLNKNKQKKVVSPFQVLGTATVAGATQNNLHEMHETEEL